MISDKLFFIELILSFLPFALFAFLNSKANVKKQIRNRQYMMPVVAVVYSTVLLIFLERLAAHCLQLFLYPQYLYKLGYLSGVGSVQYLCACIVCDHQTDSDADFQ